ncbi:MAG TPA: hypothetical protein VJB70_02370 [Candidatus Paceibacterota bacterium]|uniref:Uncharacterized protein n=1 Tax=Candidatus Zambryskibacteria bacterium RIFCSPHIGHO2_01_FULL_49_18 TaxID=1802740 RepID=A0A1G2T5L9_9BACT|nr:MAG: hypothetical protein UY36_C0014G0003 [Parcubacteria group bacterium GW2011_GWA1_49_11]OHA91881.1 MAG: hypothetical protein A2758_01235 [Candidatus Zambryskibacteria bacterium RIFCSPHIGHO2_01_FULL_49_18]
MPDERQSNKKEIGAEKVEEIFGDFEARGNLVGLFELAYKVDRRVNPQRYGGAEAENYDHD